MKRHLPCILLPLLFFLSCSLAFSAPVIIGHRGLGRGHAPEPENSLSAFAGALRAGAHAVELDVQLTSDGELVVAHDPRLNRISSGKGCISETPATEISKLRLRDGNGAIQEKETIPSLADALATLKSFDTADRPFVADIHIKVHDSLRGDWTGFKKCRVTSYEDVTRKTLDGLRAAGLLDRVLITSFDRRVLDLVKREAPVVKTGLLSFFSGKRVVRQAAAAGYDSVALNWSRMSMSTLRLAHRLGLSVYVWFSGKESAKADRKLWNRVEGIISDHPGALANAQDLANAGAP